MKVYMLETSESLHQRFETGLRDGLQVFATREIAERACNHYNEEVQGEVPAVVIECDVFGAAEPERSTTTSVEKKQESYYVLRHKTLKSYVTDETPEGFSEDILGWSDEVDKATEVTKEDDEVFNCDVANIITQLCYEDERLKPSDLELVLVETLVAPTKGQYAVSEVVEPPDWFVETIEVVEDENFPSRRASISQATTGELLSDIATRSAAAQTKE